MGRRAANEAILAEQDVNFTALIRGQIRREVQSEIRVGIRNLIAQFAQILSEPKRSRLKETEPPSRAEQLVEVLEKRERDRPTTKRGRVSAGLYHDFLEKAKTVLRNKCAECESASPPFKVVLINTKATPPGVTRRLFMDALDKGVRVVRKRFKMLCEKCYHQYTRSRVGHLLGGRRDTLLKALGEKCEDCGNPPRKLHIISSRSTLERGRKQPHGAYISSLLQLLDKQGPQWFKQHYIHRCRGCFTKASIANRSAR